MEITRDVSFALRMLIKKPGFALVAMLTLALGIGANTAIFTIVDAALLRGLPYKAPENLYHLFEMTPQKEYAQREFSYPDYQDYQRLQVFDGIAAYTGGGGLLSGRGEPQRIFAPSASANFFSVLGVEPLLGRTFREGEDKPGGERVTVLTYGLWQRMFGGKADILGQSLTINSDNYTVIGILPASFQFAPRANDLWLSYQPTPNQLTRRQMHGTNLIARLRSGVSLEQAKAEMNTVASRIEQEYKESHAGTTAIFVPLQQQVTGPIKPMLLALLAAVGFVLLMVCANLASLLLARALTRQKEIAIRAALGASRGRVIRQLLTEATLLSLLGGLGGLVVAYFGIDALVASLPANQLNAMPFLQSLRMDTGVLAFTLVVSMITGIVFGLMPALQASRLDLHEALKEGGRNSLGGARHRLRGALVITEIALAVVLLVGAGLMMKSLWRLMQTNIGFDPHNVLTLTVVLPASKYTESNRILGYYDQLQARLAALPGVAGVGAVNILPLQGGNTTRFVVDGEPVPPPGQETEANIRIANASYFPTLGIPLLKGRYFNGNDKPDATPVVIINKTLADRILGGRDPVGRRLSYPGFPNQLVEIVGVVGDVKITGLDQAIRPVLYYPLTQSSSGATNLVIRTNTDAATLSQVVRNECRNLEPDVALFNVQTMETMIAMTPAAFMRRFPALLIGLFAGVALLLASIGIYGVVSYSVSQQTHDIGIRMALGARVSDILKMVLKQGLTLALAGVGIGVVVALALMRTLSSLLYDVSASDPLTFIVVISVLISVALLACLIPARRAAKVDPLVALRWD